MGTRTWEQQRDIEYAIATDLNDLTLKIADIAVKNKVSYSAVMRVAKKRGLMFIRKPGRPKLK